MSVGTDDVGLDVRASVEDGPGSAMSVPGLREQDLVSWDGQLSVNPVLVHGSPSDGEGLGAVDAGLIDGHEVHRVCYKKVMNLGHLGRGLPMLIQQPPVTVPGAGLDPQAVPVAIEDVLGLVQGLV